MRVAAEQSRSEGWRRHVARVIALAFVLQCFGLFAAGPRPVAATASVARLAAAHGCATDPHHGHHGKRSGDACPMCQTLGCALPGAPPVALVARSNERLFGLLSAAKPALPPRAPPREDARPRGPPFIV